MEVKGKSSTGKPGIVEKVTEFYQEVRVEMSKVAWPGREEVKSLTQVVLYTLLLLTIIIGAYDLVFLNLMRLILRLG
jgi:preprotein translocase subunit SecE